MLSFKSKCKMDKWSFEEIIWLLIMIYVSWIVDSGKSVLVKPCYAWHFLKSFRSVKSLVIASTEHPSLCFQIESKLKRYLGNVVRLVLSQNSTRSCYTWQMRFTKACASNKTSIGENLYGSSLLKSEGQEWNS